MNSKYEQNPWITRVALFFTVFLCLAVIGGLYFLKQPMSAKGYYLMAYPGAMLGAYLLPEAMRLRGSKLTVALIVLAFYSIFLLFGLTKLTENLSTKGYYFMAYVAILFTTFIASYGFDSKYIRNTDNESEY